MSNILTNNINPRSGNVINIGGVNDKVSIAGTLTYEDVTSVDSIGVVTARSGLNVVGGGITAVGVITSYSGIHVGAGVSAVGIITAQSGVEFGTVGSGVTINAVGTGTSLGFLVNGSERARVDSSGRLLVGTSTSRSVGAERNLQIEGTAGATGGVSIVRNSNDGGGSALNLGKSRGTVNGSNTIINSGDTLGLITFNGADGNNLNNVAAQILAAVDGTPGPNDMPGRLTFSTTADGASSPTEHLRISNNGTSQFTAHSQNSTNVILALSNNNGNDVIFEAHNNTVPGISGPIRVSKSASTNRSINAAGTVNQNGSDYAEYFKKSGNFTIQKGDVVGINSVGLLTNVFDDAISFCVKSTDPGIVGGDNWFTEPRPKSGDGQEVDSSTPEYAEWEERLELARQTVDRIAFAGQVPVNVIGATPGQYIVPIATEEGGISGIAKDETDLTLTEYMRAVGKVIAIEDDGRSRIIVKVA